MEHEEESYGPMGSDPDTLVRISLWRNLIEETAHANFTIFEPVSYWTKSVENANNWRVKVRVRQRNLKVEEGEDDGFIHAQLREPEEGEMECSEVTDHHKLGDPLA